jgi:hypothetical protein
MPNLRWTVQVSLLLLTFFISTIWFVVTNSTVYAQEEAASSVQVTATSLPSALTSESPTPTVEPSDSPTIVPSQSPSSTPIASTSGLTIDSTPSSNPTASPSSPDDGVLIAVLFTDKADYSPTDTALIFGKDFSPNTIYSLLITSDNLSTTVSVSSDATGSFAYSYTLDGTYRPNYLVTASDNSGDIVAVTSFTDSPPALAVSIKDYSQCTNEDGDGYATGDTGCRWTNGNIQSNNSAYFEGEATVQRVLLEDITAGSHTITFQYNTTKGGKHAYDFLTDDNFSELAPNALTAADICDGAASSKLPSCSTAPVNTSGLIPTDPNAAGLDSSANRHFKIRNGIIDAISTPTIVSGTYAGDSETAVTVTFHVDPTTCTNKYTVQGTGACAALISFGAHISKSTDWTPQLTAVTIPGSPYHVSLSNLDGTSIGQRDNQMQASAIVVTDTTSVSTTIHNSSHSEVTSVNVGTTVHDSATVTNTGGVNGTPTGTVVFDWYTNGTCQGTPNSVSSSFSLSGGTVDATTFTKTPAASGSYSFKAHYTSSDTSKWTSSDGPCEPLTVNKVNSTTVTEIHDTIHTPITSIPAGSTVHDKAIVSGGAGTPTGTVTFQWFTNGTCQGTAADTSSALSLTSGAVDATSFAKGPLSAGSYSFKASYSGDTVYNSSVGDCEPLIVSQLAPSVTTEIHNGTHGVVTSVDAGSTVHDKATVSGSFGTPTGTVTFSFYSTINCTGSSTSAGTISLVSGVADPSTNMGPLSAGSYSFKAHYNGDTNYADADAACEPLTVNMLTPTVTTNIHGANHGVVTSVALGTTVHDEATITGGYNPTGTVSFTFFNNGTCTNTGFAAGTVAISSGVAHPSSAQGPLTAGSYSFMAHYNGDTNNNAVDGSCEPLTVDKASTTVTTQVHNTSHQDVTNTAVALGSVVHDNSTVGGQVGTIAPTGTITYHFYTATCTGTPTDETVAIGTESSATSALGAGSYSFKAEYSGDTNYNASVGDCEPFTVSKANLGVATTLHKTDESTLAVGGSVDLGSTLHDEASVSGIIASFTPTNNVSFTFHSTNDCSDQGVASGSVALSGNIAHPSDAQGPLAAGQYGFKATIAGDDNYNGATGICENFTVNQGTLGLTTTIHTDSPDLPLVGNAVLGASLHDEASVSGIISGFAPTNNVTFKYYTNHDCTDGEANGSASIVSGVAHPSNSRGPLAAGNYAFRAFYDGTTDPNYGPDNLVSPCEPFTVDKATPTVVTELHNSSEGVITTETLDPKMHDEATVSGISAFMPTGNVSFTFYNNGACTNTGAAAGTIGLDGTGVSHPSTEQTLPGVGSYSFKAHYNGDSNYNGADADCEPFTYTTLTVIKTTNGDDDTFNFTANGPINGNPTTLTPAITTNSGTGNIVVPVIAGVYTVGETVPSGWNLVGVSCAGSAQESGPTSSQFSIPVGTNQSCTFENTKINETRTQGFWSTHTNFTNTKWGSVLSSETNMNQWAAACSTSPKVLSVSTTAGQNVVMGGFWSNIAKTSTGTNRANVDKSRMALLQQIEAALLNKYGLGANDNGLINAAKTAYCGTNTQAMGSSTNALSNWNQTGDTISIGVTGNATTQLSKSQANMSYWNTTK